MKIIHKITASILEKRPFYSFEFFPPKTEAGLHNLYQRLERMATLDPIFVDVTWGAGGSSQDSTLELCRTIQQYFDLDVLMHFTCTNLNKDQTKRILDQAHAAGIRSIMALRGDPPAGNKSWIPPKDGFSYAYQLIEFIRQNYGDEFCLAVGAYPEGHFDCNDKDQDVKHLKMKIDAGADFAVTQLFYDMEEYQNFLQRCKSHNITCPIIPGIMPIHNYQRFSKFTDFCQIKVPNKIREDLEPMQHDDEKVQEYGIQLATQMCQQLKELDVPGFHFYTLNLETPVVSTLERLDLVDDSKCQRKYPWRESNHGNRRGSEEVRPIFWSNRPKSYLARTVTWDDFPNGRWGSSKSPTFGALNEYYMIRRGIGWQKKRKNHLEMWGAPETLEEVSQVFIDFCQGSIDQLPWSEVPIQGETSRISDQIVQLNRSGFFTINSQPAVNGVDSSDPVVGWGDQGGRVYQKAYIEFFCSPQNFHKLLAKIETLPTLTYHATNQAGQSYSNLPQGSVTAVTWGVFPGKEIIQPTVVDQQSFVIWKDEAFSLWKEEWQSLMVPESKSSKLIGEIHDTFYLVNIVENDYVSGDLFRLFEV